MEKRAFYIVGLFVLALGMAFGCGGSKETVKFEPDPFPKPDELTEETIVQEEETPEPASADIIVEKKEPLFLRNIYFAFDRADLTPEGRAILAENARKLEENPEIYIRIEGHCDERGTVEYNLALGERRALYARDYLTNYGIAAGRITVISYGKERLVDTRNTEEAWARNRRSEFVILN